MKFGSFPVTDAAGVVLAHTVRAGAVLKKGHVLTPADIAMLEARGVSTVMGVRLDPGDVAEDPAAARIARRLTGVGLMPSPARTGRCNLVAGTRGVLKVAAAAIDAANQVDEAVTIATVPDLAAVAGQQIVATVKIIPFAVPAEVLCRVEDALATGALTLHPFRERKVALVSTVLPGMKDSVVAATEEVVRGRVTETGGVVICTSRIPHEPQAVKDAVAAGRETGADLLLIVGASATSDRGDVVPAGIVAAGGVLEHFGMPVDPGNLLLLARCGGMSILVLPGCARSPKLNGADWVLQRLAAGIHVSGRDIMGMGVGGLLVDTPARPLPRALAVRESIEPPVPRVAAIILAAGRSQRMGARNKLLMPVEGQPLVRRAVSAVLAAPVSDVIVVTGHDASPVAEALRGLNVRFVHNPRFAEGLSASLKAGLDALPPSTSGAVICLGDMPAVAPQHIARLIDEFRPGEGREIGVPTHRGTRGNPVLWGSRLFEDIRNLSGDVGARHLIGANESLVYEVEFEDTGVLMDLDTPAQWEDYLAKSSPRRE